MRLPCSSNVVRVVATEAHANCSRIWQLPPPILCSCGMMMKLLLPVRATSRALATYLVVGGTKQVVQHGYWTPASPHPCHSSFPPTPGCSRRSNKPCCLFSLPLSSPSTPYARSPPLHLRAKREDTRQKRENCSRFCLATSAGNRAGPKMPKGPWYC